MIFKIILLSKIQKKKEREIKNKIIEIVIYKSNIKKYIYIYIPTYNNSDYFISQNNVHANCFFREIGYFLSYITFIFIYIYIFFF